MPNANIPTVAVTLPDWVAGFVDWTTPLTTDEARMRLAVALSRENVERGTGGPFGAVITEAVTGKLVAVGVNRVVPSNNSALHAEMVAFMMAQAALGSFTLAAPGMPGHELATSCEPCAMCLGATLWSGVKRAIAGATREDAPRLHFDEGPVFPQSIAYLEARGITIVRGVLRDEANAVLELYRSRSGKVYNA